MWTEELLDEKLSTPSESLIEDVKKIEGDIMILGAGGKMGPTLSLLAKNAMKAAGISKKVIAVSRFTDPFAARLLNDNGIETVCADLLEPGCMDQLPDVRNIIYMAGRKFGTGEQACMTWAMNTWLPSLIAERYKKSNIVVFSTGNVYPLMPISSGGSTEETPVSPVGEYGMSSLGRERVFEYGSQAYGTQIFLYRLNYAVDLRYGVLFDIASRVMAQEPIPVSSPCFNCIWQGDANEIAIRALLHTGSPVVKMNVTGPETVSVKYAANMFGELLDKKPVFEGEESSCAFLSNASKTVETFGYPTVGINTLIKWQAEWILSGGRSLGKPTHFEERKGNF